MKIIIKEKRLSILKENKDEITFHSFFRHILKFLEGLLTDPVNSQPSEELKNDFGGDVERKDIIKKLIHYDIIRRDNKLKETPKEVTEEDKSDVRYEITYSVPTEGFKDKIHRLHDSLINNSLNESKKYQLARQRELDYDEKTRQVIRQLFPNLRNRFDEIAKDEQGKPILTQKGEEQTYLQYLQRDLKHKFILDNADVRFEPIAAQIAYKELGFGQNPDNQKINRLRRILKIITSSHQSEYDDNLNNMNYNSLEGRFIGTMNKMSAELRKNAETQEYNGKSDYTIYPIDSFEEAQKFYQYTPKDSRWCLTHMDNMFDAYTEGGINKIYFAAKQGFENVQEIKQEGCPLDEYGLSLISVIVDPEGNLAYCTTRWNHLNGGSDDSMDELQLSEVINKNFFKTFLPYSFEEVTKRSEELISKVESYIRRQYDESIYDEGVKEDLITLCSPKGDIEDYAKIIEPEEDENLIWDDETEEWVEDEDYEYESEINDDSKSEYIYSSKYWIVDLAYYDSDYDEGTRFVIFNSDLRQIEIKEIFSEVKYINKNSIAMFSVKRLNGDYETFTLMDNRKPKKKDPQMEIDFEGLEKYDLKLFDVVSENNFNIYVCKTNEGWKKCVKDEVTDKTIGGFFDDIDVTSNSLGWINMTVTKDGKHCEVGYNRENGNVNYDSPWYDRYIRLYSIRVFTVDGISYFYNRNNMCIGKTTEKVIPPEEGDFRHVNDFRWKGELLKGDWNLFSITDGNQQKQVWLRAEDGLTIIKNGYYWDNGEKTMTRLR